MALSTATAPLVVLLLLVAAGGSGAGGSGDDDGWSFSFDTMIGCAPPLGPAEAAEAGGAAASFRPSLAALPSAAAATGFASLPFASAPAGAGARRGRARALGLCFGPAAPAESGCVECLQAAVAAVGACAGDVRNAGAWCPGCAVVYADDEDGASSLADEDGDSRPRSPAGDARSEYPDNLEQRLADLAEALAQHNRRPLWKMALSVLFYLLAAIGAVSVVLLLCAFLAGFCLAESLFRNVQAAGLQRGNAAGGAEQGEGIAVYVAATNGPAPVWSVAMQLRFH